MPRPRSQIIPVLFTLTLLLRCGGLFGWHGVIAAE
jgi:hypothetical protein